MVYECIGQYAETPYYLEDACINIFSMEELAYFLYENALIVDSSIMKKELCVFIDEELGLYDLASELMQLINNDGRLVDFVSAILSYMDYCSEHELEELVQYISDNDNTGNLSRRKSRGDVLLNGKKYVGAIREYETALSFADQEETDKEELTALYNNLGVAYARLFYFDKAAECFDKSCEIEDTKAARMNYLAALRLSMNKEEYIERIKQEGADVRLVNEQEKRIDESVQRLGGRIDYARFKRAIDCKENGELAEYNSEIVKILENIKGDYRKHIEHEYI
ncbi:MAG: tetratricopeptide repeat protein [Lachnospiraceae bacterium]|nr:tetratricopeptide repeat protein [Lachnospiraceae bacterium]